MRSTSISRFSTLDMSWHLRHCSRGYQPFSRRDCSMLFPDEVCKELLFGSVRHRRASLIIFWKSFHHSHELVLEETWHAFTNRGYTRGVLIIHDKRQYPIHRIQKSQMSRSRFPPQSATTIECPTSPIWFGCGAVKPYGQPMHYPVSLLLHNVL